MTTLLEFLNKNKNGYKMVNISIAVEAAKMLLAGELTLDDVKTYQHPLIWGDGWYALFIQDVDSKKIIFNKTTIIKYEKYFKKVKNV